jgi:hypothetical protein
VTPLAALAATATGEPVAEGLQISGALTGVAPLTALPATGVEAAVADAALATEGELITGAIFAPEDAAVEGVLRRGTLFLKGVGALTVLLPTIDEGVLASGALIGVVTLVALPTAEVSGTVVEGLLTSGALITPAPALPTAVPATEGARVMVALTVVTLLTEAGDAVGGGVLVNKALTGVAPLTALPAVGAVVEGVLLRGLTGVALLTALPAVAVNPVVEGVLLRGLTGVAPLTALPAVDPVVDGVLLRGLTGVATLIALLHADDSGTVVDGVLTRGALTGVEPLTATPLAEAGNAVVKGVLVKVALTGAAPLTTLLPADEGPTAEEVLTTTPTGVALLTALLPLVAGEAVLVNVALTGVAPLTVLPPTAEGPVVEGLLIRALTGVAVLTALLPLKPGDAVLVNVALTGVAPLTVLPPTAEGPAVEGLLIRGLTGVAVLTALLPLKAGDAVLVKVALTGVAPLTVLPATAESIFVEEVLIRGLTGVAVLTALLPIEADDAETEGELITGALTGVPFLTALPATDEGCAVVVAFISGTLTEVVLLTTLLPPDADEGMPIRGPLTAVVQLTALPTDTDDTVPNLGVVALTAVPIVDAEEGVVVGVLNLGLLPGVTVLIPLTVVGVLSLGLLPGVTVLIPLTVAAALLGVTALPGKLVVDTADAVVDGVLGLGQLLGVAALTPPAVLDGVLILGPLDTAGPLLPEGGGPQATLLPADPVLNCGELPKLVVLEAIDPVDRIVLIIGTVEKRGLLDTAGIRTDPVLTVPRELDDGVPGRTVLPEGAAAHTIPDNGIVGGFEAALDCGLLEEFMVLLLLTTPRPNDTEDEVTAGLKRAALVAIGPLVAPNVDGEDTSGRLNGEGALGVLSNNGCDVDDGVPGLGLLAGEGGLTALPKPDTLETD